MSLTNELNCQAHARVANVTKREAGDTDRRGASFMGGKPRWYWVEMTESQPQDGGALKDYTPKPEIDWQTTRSYGTDYL